MRRINTIAGWSGGVLVGLLYAQTAAAQTLPQPTAPVKPDAKATVTPPKPKYPVSPGLIDPPKEPKPAPVVQPFRQSPLGAFPHLGNGSTGGQGYRHYDHPDYRYDIWYRPDRFGWGVAERCAPPPFRPRGYGNLFNRPSTCYRMDYNRYVLKNHRTEYGPSYYLRSPDQRCPDCDHSEMHRPKCNNCRTRRTSVFSITGCR